MGFFNPAGAWSTFFLLTKHFIWNIYGGNAIWIVMDAPLLFARRVRGMGRRVQRHMVLHLKNIDLFKKGFSVIMTVWRVDWITWWDRKNGGAIKKPFIFHV
jgi:hypothetical protein